jgi:hypothetical protein
MNLHYTEGNGIMWRIIYGSKCCLSSIRSNKVMRELYWVDLSKLTAEPAEKYSTY